MLIEVLIILNGRFPMHRFVAITSPLQYAHRPKITFEYTGKNAIDLEIFEDVTRHDR